MGSAWGRGVREGPAPQEAREISSAQQGQRQHGEGRGGTGKSDVMKKDQRVQSEPFFLQDGIPSTVVKTICIDPLSTRCCTSSRE
jgi:hypothetical protein